MSFRVNSLTGNYTTGNFATGNFYQMNTSYITSDTITSSSVAATTVSAATITATTVANLARTVQTGRGQRNIVVGWAPTSFATGLSGSFFNFLLAPGLTQPTSTTDANLLHLPASAVVTRVVLTNNGTPITSVSSAATYTVGSYPIADGVAKTPVAPLFFSATTQALINTSNGVAVGGTLAADNAGFASAGFATTTAMIGGQTIGATDNLVSVAIASQNTTAGSLRVTIEYTNA